MSEVGKQIIGGMDEALAWVKGEKDAVRVVYADGREVKDEMTAIPDDIMQAARDALQQSSTQVLRGDAVRIIARAIMAERERCAMVATKHMLHADSMFDERVRRSRNGESNLELAASTACGMSHVARRIAAAIRKVDKP